MKKIRLALPHKDNASRRRHTQDRGRGLIPDFTSPSWSPCRCFRLPLQFPSLCREEVAVAEEDDYCYRNSKSRRWQAAVAGSPSVAGGFWKIPWRVAVGSLWALQPAGRKQQSGRRQGSKPPTRCRGWVSLKCQNEIDPLSRGDTHASLHRICVYLTGSVLKAGLSGKDNNGNVFSTASSFLNLRAR